MRIWRIVLVLAGFAGSADWAAAQMRSTPEETRAVDAALAQFTSPTLTRFASEEEFRLYRAAVQEADNVRRYVARRFSRRILLAQADQPVRSDGEEPLCEADDPTCAPVREDDEGSIVVTGAMVRPPSNPSITNNQMVGVEEGDVVKQVGHHLLVLQDGRIFVVDIRAGGRRALAVTDRVDVYRNPRADTWYDEMLVFGDRILITGYSYRIRSTELSVFRLSPDGRLVREGAFFISSNDYYNSSNYATRLIGDSLVIYTPIHLRDLSGERDWPLVRRWAPGKTDEEGIDGRPLFDATGVYRPVRDLVDPVVHSVSVCSLGPAAPERDLVCRTTAFVGPADASWYVAPDSVYLWTTESWEERGEPQRDCRPEDGTDPADAIRAIVYRLPIGAGTPGVLAAVGAPTDQFSMQAGGDHFRALVAWRSALCQDRYWPAHLRYFDIGLASFAPTVADADPGRYTPMPSVGPFVANRFTDDHLVYGGLSRYRSGLPSWDDEEDEPDAEELRRRREALAMPPAYAVPLDRPDQVRPLAIGHSVIRAERVGDDIVLTGYRDRLGLRVTLIDLERAPRIADSIRLDGRFESEGRSHAFNSRVDPDGAGLLGLPTTARIRESGRAPWYSRASDLSFVAMSRAGDLSALGDLESSVRYGNDDDGNPEYECEVSCIDWYGNSRPIFTDGRVFALTGTELIEGTISGGRIRALRRLNLTASPRR